jgi:hypothetical protein
MSERPPSGSPAERFTTMRLNRIRRDVKWIVWAVSIQGAAIIVLAVAVTFLALS